ncbi:MAG: protein kinase [Melioribacteraceae bacterium]|nr:protein kinase [Melioribacteraceae bacterium]
MDKLINKKIENYTIISLLGKGGMGVVYKAHDEKLNRFVAIKVLNAPHVKDSKRMMERFKVEAQNHAQLVHQNIVTVYGFVEFDNLLGIVMEYVDGESLEKVIFKNRRLHVFDVVYITDQLLDGISYAHSKGYIHRDIKPSNIIVNSEGVVKIMDFGISKSIDDENVGTRSGARIGTIHYMSPEQIKGRNVNRVSDLYSVGCTMYDMLSGQPPFDSKNDFDIMNGHLNENPKNLTQHLPTIPIGLNTIVQKLLKKPQDERYQTCSEVKNDLQQFDKLLKTADANYFNERKVRRRLSKRKSIISSIIFLLAFFTLVIFVVYQVKDFMKYKGYKVFEENSISTLFETEEKFYFSKFEKYNLPTKFNLNSLAINDNNFTIVGDSGVILTKQDTSENWLNNRLEENIKLFDSWTFPNKKMIIIGEKSSFIYNIDAVNQWYSILDKDFSLYDIEFINNKKGFVVGSDGLILTTLNSGQKWNRIRTNSEETFFDISMINNDVGYIVGRNGTILKTSNGGYSWEKQNSPSTKYLKSIDFNSEQIGISVGGYGTILRTEDSGKEWNLLKSVTTRRLNKVKFLSEKSVIIIGDAGTILFSTDAGVNWKSVESNIYNNWNDISVAEDGKIFIVGSYGTMIELEKGEE